MRVYLLGLAFVFAGSSLAQDFGSDNLAPYLPSPQLVVERMLEAAQVKSGETVYDLGSGDGRIVITAARKYGANAVGVEISEVLCKSTEKKVNALGLTSQVKIIHGSALKVDLSPADVVTLYLRGVAQFRDAGMEGSARRDRSCRSSDPYHLRLRDEPSPA